MKKIVPDPPLSMPDAAASDDSLLDRVAADRALNYYLLGNQARPSAGMSTYAINENVNLETALIEASSLLRCASASASEAGHNLCGAPRDLVLSVLHLVDLAKAYVDKSLDGLTTY